MRKLFLFFLTLSLFVSCQIKRESTKESFLLPQGAIPISYIGHIYIFGVVDSAKGNFVFDTGANNLYFDSTFFYENGLKCNNLAKAKLPGAGNEVQDISVIIDTVKFSFKDNLYQTTLVPIFQLKPILGDFSDGIIGFDYFSDSVLAINYEHEYIQIFPRIDSFDIAGYTKIGLQRINDRFLIPLCISINDTLKINGSFLLDFGSGGSITFTSFSTRTFNLDEVIKSKVRFDTEYGGVGGNSASYLFRANSFEIGGYTLPEVIMDFSLDTSGAMSSNRYLGILGNDIFERFDIIIDFSCNNFYIKPNSKFNNPFEFSRLGFSYVDRSKTLKSWVVTGLYQNSNAERAGLNIDDLIIAVNGTSIQNLPYPSQKGYFETVNDLTLTVLRKGVKLHINFKLEFVLSS
jgi:hypothetical protein